MVRVQMKNGEVIEMTEEEYEKHRQERHQAWVQRMIEKNPSHNYWAICQYSGTWLPRAAFIPENHPLVPLIHQLRTFSENHDIIFQKWEKLESGQRSDGYYVNRIVCDDQHNPEIQQIIHQLDSHVFSLDHDHEGEIDDGSLFYYINDINASKTQEELHKALLAMKSHDDVPMNVIGCIILSDCKLKKENRIMMRFFCGEPDVHKVEMLLSQDSRVRKVDLASKEDGTSAGYGFMQVDSEETYRQFKDQVVEINGLAVWFNG